MAAAALGATGPLARSEIDARYRTDGSRGHHMGDYIPVPEMNAFLAGC